MKSLNSYLTIFLLLVGTTTAMAQNDAGRQQRRMIDSIKNVYLTLAAIKNPALRQATISTDLISNSNIKTHLHGNKLFDGRIRQVRTNATVNLPIKSWGKNSIIASASFSHQQLRLKNIIPYQSGLGDIGDQNIDKITIGFTATYTRLDTLFGHSVLYTSSITGLTGRTNSIQRISYLGGIIFPLKHTAVTNSSLGVLINLDPSINLPVIPIYNYWHKFDNNFEINMNLPQQLSFLKPIGSRVWASFGTSLSSSVAFFRYNQPSIPQNTNYSTLELKTGPGMEFRFARKLIFGIKGGIITPLQARSFEVDKKATDYFMNNNVSTAPYLNFSISLLPIR